MFGTLPAAPSRCIGCGSIEDGSPYTIEKGLFLVLEYIEGGSLWDLMTRQLSSKKNLYTTKEAVRLLIGVAKGLQFLHERQPTVGWWHTAHGTHTIVDG